MALILTDDFETGTFAAWTDTEGPIIVSVKHRRSGTQAALTPGEDLIGYMMKESTAFASGTELFVRFYIYLHGIPTSETILFSLRDSDFVPTVELRLSGASFLVGPGKIRLVTTGDVHTAWSSGAMRPKEWYRVEVRSYRHNTLGQAEVRIFSGEDTEAYITAEAFEVDTLASAVLAQRFIFGTEAGIDPQITYDDVRIESAAVPLAGAWIGPAAAVDGSTGIKSDDYAQITARAGLLRAGTGRADAVGGSEELKAGASGEFLVERPVAQDYGPDDAVQSGWVTERS